MVIPPVTHDIAAGAAQHAVASARAATDIAVLRLVGCQGPPGLTCHGAYEGRVVQGILPEGILPEFDGDAQRPLACGDTRFEFAKSAPGSTDYPQIHEFRVPVAEAARDGQPHSAPVRDAPECPGPGRSSCASTGRMRAFLWSSERSNSVTHASSRASASAAYPKPRGHFVAPGRTGMSGHGEQVQPLSAKPGQRARRRPLRRPRAAPHQPAARPRRRQHPGPR